MEFREVELPGVLLATSPVFADDRGSFFENFRAAELKAATGREFPVAQVNYSMSRRNTIRGIHGVRIPPGQAKYVTCVTGSLLDIVVDIRIGSPTYRSYTVNLLHAEESTAVYVPEGFGHGFRALTDDATICYLLSSSYVPGTQFELDPLDPELALPWELTEPPLLSAKDSRAPGLAQAEADGILPLWETTRTIGE